MYSIGDARLKPSLRWRLLAKRPNSRERKATAEHAENAEINFSSS